jgi:hypothetical protein
MTLLKILANLFKLLYIQYNWSVNYVTNGTNWHKFGIADKGLI